MLTQERVKELFTYDPESGELRWRVQRGPKRPGDVAGCETLQTVGKRYLQIRIDYKLYYVHRIVYLYQTGEIPIEVDHGDGNGLNNRWDNLRNVDRLENRKNCRRAITNTSGVVGVSWSKERNKWEAYITCNMVRRNLGRFVSLEEAVSRRKQAEAELAFHINHGSDRPL